LRNPGLPDMLELGTLKYVWILPYLQKPPFESSTRAGLERTLARVVRIGTLLVPELPSSVHTRALGMERHHLRAVPPMLPVQSEFLVRNALQRPRGRSSAAVLRGGKIPMRSVPVQFRKFPPPQGALPFSPIAAMIWDTW